MDSDFSFLVAIPAFLAVSLLVMSSRFRAQIAITATTGILLLVSRIPWDRLPAAAELRSYAGGFLLIVSPFAGVLLCQVLLRRQLEEHPWLLVVAVPLAYWLGLIVLGIQIGGILGLVHV